MTKHTLYTKTLRNPFLQMAYKTLILFYSFYMMFSSSAFALQVEAPEGKSFIEIEGIDPMFRDDLVVDERIEKIQSFYKRYNLPLAAHAADFIASADHYEIDWKLKRQHQGNNKGYHHFCNQQRYNIYSNLTN